MSSPKIQLNALDGSLWYKNRVEKLNEEELTAVKEAAGEFWWTDNDQITLLTINFDGSYVCERRKRVWSYRNGTYTYTNYKFVEPTEQQVLALSDILLAKFEKLRIERLKTEADKLSGILATEYNGLISNFKSMRNRMLIDTDWSQLADAPLSDEDKALYRAFRQYLRDMPEDPAWLSNDVFQVDFPITPKVYLQRYPNRDVEYLSVPEHFENQAALRAKYNLARVYRHLGLPGLHISDEEWETAGYQVLSENLNKYLHKINRDLEFSINFKIIEEDRPDTYGEVTGHSTQVTIDELNKDFS